MTRPKKTSKKAAKKSPTKAVKKTNKITKRADKQTLNKSLSEMAPVGHRNDIGCCIIRYNGTEEKFPNIRRVECEEIARERSGTIRAFIVGGCPP